MKISKLEGIKLLSELNMPTVKLLDIRQILEGKEPLINRRTNLDEIREFVEQYQSQ